MPKCTSTMTSLLLLQFIAHVSGSAYPTNCELHQSNGVLTDWSFEICGSVESDSEINDEHVTTGRWKVTKRTSLWDVERQLSAPITCCDKNEAICGLSRSGRCSLDLTALGSSSYQMAFVSQYVKYDDDRSDKADDDSSLGGTVSKDGPLLIEFWTSGESSKFSLRADIDYAEETWRYLTVLMKTAETSEVKQTEKTDDGDQKWKKQFVRSCILVPNFGRVRALAIHLVTEAADNYHHSHGYSSAAEEGTLLVDDVIVRHLETDDEMIEVISNQPDCKLYVDSLPRSRHVVADFLRPVRCTSCNSSDGLISVTLATQLTIDRLYVLERLASIWKGPISAALMIYKGDDESGNSERIRSSTTTSDVLTDVVKLYYKSINLQSFVTIHLVHEDDANRSKKRQSQSDRVMYPVNFLRNIAIANVRTSHVFYVDVDLFPVFSVRDIERWVVEAAKHLNDVGKDSSSVETTAFIVPVFNYELPPGQHEPLRDDSSSMLNNVPQTKRQLLNQLKAPNPAVKPLAYSSHRVVDYGKWMSVISDDDETYTSQAYLVDYIQDMEPYFVVSSKAPAMSDFYAGYGRDKCAYSYDLAAFGFRFAVLPAAYLIYTPDKPGTSTIYQRSGGVRPDMFFSIENHRSDVSSRHFRWPSDYSLFRRNDEMTAAFGRWLRTAVDRFPSFTSDKTTTPGNNGAVSPMSNQLQQQPQISAEYIHTDGLLSQGQRSYSSESTFSTDVRQTDGENVAHQYIRHVNEFDALLEELLPAPPELTSYANGLMLADRHDIIVEKLMSAYGVTTYVELTLDRSRAPTINGPLNVMLPLMQPDVAIAVQPEADIDEHIIDGLYESYRSTGVNLSALLEEIRVDHPGPTQYSVVVSDLEIGRWSEFARSLVAVATDVDVVVMYNLLERQYSTLFESVRTAASQTKPTWTLHQLFHKHLLIKSGSLNTTVTTPVPALPLCRDISPEKTFSTTSNVDIMLMSKNRPLQTFAFLESLSQMVTGVGTVWIVLKSESSLTDAGYQLIDRCFGNGSTIFQSPFTSGSTSHPPFRVEFVSDTTNDRWILNDIHTSPEASNRKLHTLGRTLADTVHLRSSASHVMLAVDEMVWIRPVNLSRVVKLLKHCNTGKDEDEIFSMQLRLGRNMGGYSTLPDRENRLFPVSDDGYRLGVDADADSSGKNGMLQSQPSPSTDNSSPMYAFYPRRWPYDFGYVLNVDGVVLRRRDLVNELAGGADGDNGPIDNCRTPGCIENLWIRRSLRRRSRQWHAMYTGPWSTVVNNALVEDARVAGTADGQLSDGSRKLGERLVVDRKRIDVRTFATEHENDLVTAHTRLPVNYIDLPENCK